MNGQTIFLVDDDPSVLKGLSRLLRAAGFEVCGFQSAADYLLHYDNDVPGCAVLDVSLGDVHGLDLLRATASDDYARPTIFITGSSDIATSIRAMKSGAIDFLTKPVDADVLITAIREALERDQHARAHAARRAAVASLLSRLTPRERDVLKRVIEGRLNKQIAADLNIAEKTVKFHRGRLMAKMNARSVADLVRLTMGTPSASGSRTVATGT